jgi:hypothetical protein
MVIFFEPHAACGVGLRVTCETNYLKYNIGIYSYSPLNRESVVAIWAWVLPQSRDITGEVGHRTARSTLHAAMFRLRWDGRANVPAACTYASDLKRI